MKKTIITSVFAFMLSSFTVLSLAATEFSGDLLSKPHRAFEIGINTNTSLSNNTFGLEDILVKEIKIDLQKMVSDMPDSGFDLALLNKEKVYIDLNASSRFRFSFFTDLESSMHFNISKDFFSILGSGISVDKEKNIDISLCADSFFDIGTSFQTIIKGYGVKITPTYFVPLFYVPNTSFKSSYLSKSNGEITFNAKADVDIYTAIDMEGYVDNGDKHSDFDIGEVLSNGGFDFSFEIERNWLHGLNAGLYTRIPMVAGKLNYRMTTTAYASFHEENLMDFITDSNKKLEDVKSGHVKPSTYNDKHENEEEGYDFYQDSFKAYRPLKLGLNATYMPWGNWLKIQPSLGFAVRNPYTQYAKFYPEYSLDLNLSLLASFLGFQFGTAYQSQVYQHRFGMSLNIHAVELVAQVSMCGTSFISTFHTVGYGAFAGVRIGI